MPSAAAAKLEKQASTEAVDPIKQAIVIIEHKIRNLEKRKRKIESYREEQKNGKELNADQLNAVSKFDEVILTLDFARDLSKQFNGISLDAAKQQKKQARKEAQERAQQEIAKIKEILLIQDVLQNIGTESAREDFLQGRNGAAQLTEEDLKYLDDIYLEVFPKRGNEEGLPPFADQVQTSAEHLLSIVDGKPKDVVGTTYIKLKELVQSIHGCGYFDQNVEEATEEAVEEVAAAPAADAVAVVPAAAAAAPAASPVAAPEELVEEEETFLIETQTVLPSEPQPYPQGPGAPVVPSQPGPQGVLTAAAQSPVVNPPPPAVQQMVQSPPMVPVPTPVQAVESSFFSTAAPAFVPAQPTLPQSRPLNEVIGSVSGNFNFLQDSELDSPDLSIMLSGTPGQTAVQHVVPTSPPSNPVAVPPIPSQTFTNQNFVAVSAAPVPPKVVFQPPGDMAHHIPGFATTTPNPPPPIPMPPSHQVPGASQRPVPVHQMPPVSQPTPPSAALPQHRSTLTPAASFGAPTAAGPPHTYAAQAQQHPQPQQTQPQQQVPPQQVPQQLPPQVQVQQQQQQQPPPQAPQVQPQPVQQLQPVPQQGLAPTTPVQPTPVQPVQAPPVPAQPVPAQPQALPPAGFIAHKPEPLSESAQTSETAAAPGTDENLDEWVSSEVSPGGDWSTQTETGGAEWGQAVSNDDWNTGSNQNDGYTVQGGNRNYSGRGRGPRGGRGSSNGYTGRGRGNYQNGRGSGGGYGYRNEDRSNNYYQNGYQRDNFSGGYKRGGRGGGGNPRGGMERGGGNSRGGMDRGGRGGNIPRGNRSGNYSRGGGNKQQ